MVKKSDTDPDETVQRTEAAAPDPTQLAHAGSAGTPTRLRDLFVLEQRLGDGGMGSVYRALDLKRSKYDDPHSHVALKIIRDDVLREFPDAALALQREASRAQELSHPNIVRIYGFYDYDPADEQCFITMELLEGKPLDALLAAHPRGLAPKHALLLLEQICNGLQYAHDRRLIHSDLKPGNIFVTTDGVVKILDFGIATPLRGLEDPRPDTKYNPRALGALTPAYASLEQWERMSADPRDDIYSLGCIAYEMLSGEHPFKGIDARKASASEMQVRPLRKLTTRQNKALRRALAFRRQDRTETVEQFFFELNDRSGISGARVAAIAGVSAAVAAAGVIWALRNDPTASPPSSETAQSQQSQQEARQEEEKPPVASTFEEQCGMPASERTLQVLLDRGLQDFALVSLSASSPAEQRELEQRIGATADCIIALRRENIQSPQAEQWLEDVEPYLTR